MSRDDSISVFIAKLRQTGDEGSAAELWNVFYDSLLYLARRRLGAAPGRERDEEDVVLSVINSVLCRIRDGLANEVCDRTTLQGLVWDRFNHRIDRERGRRMLLANRALRDADLTSPDAPSLESRILSDAPPRSSEQVVEHKELVSLLSQTGGRNPTPEETAEIVRFARFIPQLANLLESLLERLPEQKLQEVAQLKLAGYSTSEIADQLGVVERTVERHLKTVREFWSKPGESSDE